MELEKGIDGRTPRLAVGPGGGAAEEKARLDEVLQGIGGAALDELEEHGGGGAAEIEA